MNDFYKDMIENAIIQRVENFFFLSGDVCRFTAIYFCEDQFFPKKWIGKGYNGFSIEFYVTGIEDITSRSISGTEEKPTKVEFLDNGVILWLFGRYKTFKLEIIGETSALNLLGGYFVD